MNSSITNVGLNGCQTSNRTNFISILLAKDDPAYVDLSFFLILDNANALCRANVSPSYVEGSLEEADILVILAYYDKALPQLTDVNMLLGNEDVQIIGFASCIDKRLTSNEEDNSLYIDVICANPLGITSTVQTPPLGKTLLNLVYDYGVKQDYRYLSLSSLMNVINYYRKFGFRHISAGDSAEDPYITYLANLNKNIKLEDGGHAARIVKTERALKLAQEVDVKGRRQLNEDLFKKEMLESFDKDDFSEDDIEDYLGEVDPRVQENAGEEGMFDFVTKLVKQGFSTTEGCRGLSQRDLVIIDEDDSVVVNCISDGFIMRKPLFPETEEPNLNAPITACQSGGKKRRGRKTRKYAKKSRAGHVTRSRASHVTKNKRK